MEGKMMKKGNGRKTETSGKKANTQTASENVRSVSNKKRAWSHIIDKANYSKGPSDNIYVFG